MNILFNMCLLQQNLAQQPVDKIFQMIGIKIVDYQINMKGIIICIALILSAYSTVILESSPSSTTITSPPGATVVVQTPGSNVIDSSIYASQIVFESLFYSRCNGDGNITVQSYLKNQVYLDGALIGSGRGSDFYELKLPCGSHNLTIIVDLKNKPAPGLRFTIEQDQSSCFICLDIGFWNQQTCSCQCLDLDNQNCKQLKIWNNYPTCGCRCPPRIIPRPATTGSIQLKANALKSQIVNFNQDNGNGNTKREKFIIGPPFFRCPRPQFYDDSSCSCKCHYRFCKPRFYFNPSLCICVPFD